MIRTPVKSSNISSIGWLADTLEVEFSSGQIYQYNGVPRAKFDELLAAESAGKFLNEHIKGTYAFARVGVAA
jgi:hypothetical protein